MKKKYLFLLLLSVISCNKNQSDYNEIDSNTVEIKVSEDWTNYSQDSIFSNIDFIPLETTSECLISDIINFRFKDSLVLINENRKRLLVFNDKGKFKYQIGNLGNGPGECLIMHDFIINDKNQIEILDYNKIELYSLDGKYLSTKKYKFMNEDIYCNPTNFIPSPSGGYYLWGSDNGNLSKSKSEKNPLMLHIDEHMKLVETFFAVGHGDGGCPTRYSTYDDKIILNPIYANYNIYQFDSHAKLSVRYRYNLGSKMLPYSFKLDGIDREQQIAGIESLSEKYVLDMLTYQEVDNWVYQNIIFKNIDYNILYSKRTKKAHIMTSYKAETNLDEIRFWGIRQKRGNQFVRDIEASWFKMELDRVSPTAYKKYNLDRFKSIKDDDNPVLFVYTLR